MTAVTFDYRGYDTLGEATILSAAVGGVVMLFRKEKGEKEEELKDLEHAIQEAKKKYEIDGIVTGALASVYQSSRIEKICKKLRLECINPLWKKDQFWLLEEIVKQLRILKVRACHL